MEMSSFNPLLRLGVVFALVFFTLSSAFSFCFLSSYCHYSITAKADTLTHPLTRQRWRNNVTVTVEDIPFLPLSLSSDFFFLLNLFQIRDSLRNPVFRVKYHFHYTVNQEVSHQKEQEVEMTKRTDRNLSEVLRLSQCIGLVSVPV